MSSSRSGGKDGRNPSDTNTVAKLIKEKNPNPRGNHCDSASGFPTIVLSPNHIVNQLSVSFHGFFPTLSCTFKTSVIVKEVKQRILIQLKDISIYKIL